jgi:hypothetical protein
MKETISKEREVLGERQIVFAEGSLESWLARSNMWE